MNTLAQLGVAALTFLAIPAAAGAQPASTAATSSVGAVAGPDYVKMAGASDLYEIESSQTVLKTTKSPDVRRFAEMMIDHHTKTTKDLTAAARAGGMNPPPPALDSEKQRMLANLKAAPAADRDKLYVQQQTAAHEQALALHSGYAESGDTAALKDAASKAVPIIGQHLSEIQRIARGP